MGHLLDALRSKTKPAELANPANPRASPDPAEKDSRNRKFRSEAAVENRVPVAIRARLLTLAAEESLPLASVLRLTDAGKGRTAAKLRAYLRARDAGAAMDDGSLPPGYSRAALCAGCGPVWLWPTAPAHVLACPWCFRRKAGKPVPHPPVTCGSCRHFRPNPLNPAAGFGGCLLETARAFYPMQAHACADFTSGEN